MTPMTRRILLLSAAVLIVGTASACGSSSSPSTTAPTSARTTAAAAGGSAQQFCALVRQQEALLQGGQVSSLLAGGTAAAWKAYIDQTTAMNQQLVDAAPPEIKASMKTMQDTTLALKAALAAVNYDVTSLGSAKLIQLLGPPDEKAATAQVVAYVKTQCGIDLTKPAA
jgi:hypothetical protein